MRTEIREHWDKLKKLSKLTEAELEESYYALLTKITFINEELIPQKFWVESEKLLEDIDLDDIDFVALTKYLKGKLWTGDKTLRDGLKDKGFKNVLTTFEILNLWMK